MSINIRRSPLTGRHLLATDKPLTKFAISPRAGALPAPRASTRKTGAGGPATGRGTPASKAPASRRSSAASLHKGALTHARALSHTYTHNKRKPCEPRAEVHWGRSGKPLLPAPTARSARPAHLLERPRRGPRARSASPTARRPVLRRARGGRRRRRLGAHHRAAPRRCSAHRPAERRRKSARAAVAAGPELATALASQETS